MLGNPTPYTPQTNFAAFQANNPTEPLPAVALDTELTDIKTAIASLISAVEDVRRSDGVLNNGIVTVAALGAGLTVPIGEFPTDPALASVTLHPIPGQVDQLSGPGFNVDASGNITAASVSTPGSITAAGQIAAAVGNIVGLLTAGSATIKGLLTAASATINGLLTTTALKVVGNIAGATAAFTGELDAAVINVSGAIGAAAANITGAVSAASAALTGALTAASATLTGALNAASIVSPAATLTAASVGTLAVSGPNIRTGKAAPVVTAGQTYQIPPNTPFVIISALGLTSLTVVLPLNPVDGQIQNISFPTTVTTLAITGPQLGTTPNPTTVATATGLFLSYIFDGPSAKWARFH